jgi:UDP-2,3-diacylglucosamine pyrophosphatase LpxH
MKTRTHYRAVFLSDLHFGFRGAKPKNLLAFLKSIECEYLYLVGDIFDLWAMKDKIFWNADCTAVIRRILKMMQQGTQIVYVTGNHDAAIRNFVPLLLGNALHVVDEHIHVTADGNRLLLIHGDRFDFVAKWLSVLGSHIYGSALAMNNVLYRIRKVLGFKQYWSLSGWLKNKTKRALEAIKSFEDAVLCYAAQQNCTGAICGHIHTAKISLRDGLLYANCGDWVESMSAIVETSNGKLELIEWHDMTNHGIDETVLSHQSR